MKTRNSYSVCLAFASMISFASGCAAQGTQVDQTPVTQGSGSRVATEQDQPASPAHPALLDPSLATKTAPDKFRVKFTTTKGDFVIEVVRAWSPNGADRFYNLVDIGYYKDVAIFRAINGFMFQFGIHGDPAVSEKWSNSNIQDDPAAGVSNFPGYVTFAKTGAPNSRSIQMFVNLGNNARLDAQGFTPFGKIVEGMDVVTNINTEYGENDPSRNIQGNFEKQGNDYILKEFPNLDLIKSATLMTE